MMTVFYREEDKIKSAELLSTKKIPEHFVWIDIYNPTPDEEKNVETQLGIQIPTKEEVWKNETLNRFYEEKGVHYLTAAVITKVDSPYPQTSAITFILAKDYLVTMRYIWPTSFNKFSGRIARSPQKFLSGSQALEGLLEEIISRVAHNSEIVVKGLDALSHQIFGSDTLDEKGRRKRSAAQNLQNVLKTLGTYADLNSKISESLHSVSRLLAYFRQVHGAGKELDHALRILMADITALLQQTNFLADKINYLLDATLGMINLEQNMIMKLFSVVTLFFLPPTLVGAVYGMNFAHMPELGWVWGYPFALFLMLVCAVAPYLMFRRKGWL